MAKRKPRGIIAIERANDIHSTKQQIDKWINHSMNVQIECNLAFSAGYHSTWRIGALPGNTVVYCVSLPQ